MNQPIEWIANDQICVVDGYVFGITNKAQTVCLGATGPVNAIIAGNADIPSDLRPEARSILTEILEESREYDRTKRPPIREGTRRSFRGKYKYRNGLAK